MKSPHKKEKIDKRALESVCKRQGSNCIKGLKNFRQETKYLGLSKENIKKI